MLSSTNRGEKHETGSRTMEMMITIFVVTFVGMSIGRCVADLVENKARIFNR